MKLHLEVSEFWLTWSDQSHMFKKSIGMPVVSYIAQRYKNA